MESGNHLCGKERLLPPRSMTGKSTFSVTLLYVVIANSQLTVSSVGHITSKVTELVSTQALHDGVDDSESDVEDDGDSSSLLVEEVNLDLSDCC